MAQAKAQIWTNRVQEIIEEQLRNKMYLFDTFTDYSSLLSKNAESIQLPSLSTTGPDTLANKRAAFLSDWTGLQGTLDGNKLDLDILISGLQTIDKIDDMQTQFNMIDTTLNSTIPKMLRNLDLQIMKILNAGTDGTHKVEVATANKFVLADILSAKEKLMAEGAQEHDLVLAVNAKHYNQIYKIEQFTSRDYLPNPTAFVNGMVGMVAGIRVIFSSQLEKVNSSGVHSATQNKEVSYLYTPASMAVAKHNNVITNVDENVALAMIEVHPLLKAGAKVVNDKFAVAIRNKS